MDIRQEYEISNQAKKADDSKLPEESVKVQKVSPNKHTRAVTRASKSDRGINAQPLTAYNPVTFKVTTVGTESEVVGKTLDDEDSVKLPGLSAAVDSVRMRDVELAGSEDEILNDAGILKRNSDSAAPVKNSISYSRNLKGLRRLGNVKKNKLSAVDDVVKDKVVAKEAVSEKDIVNVSSVKDRGKEAVVENVYQKDSEVYVSEEDAATNLIMGGVLSDLASKADELKDLELQDLEKAVKDVADVAKNELKHTDVAGKTMAAKLVKDKKVKGRNAVKAIPANKALSIKDVVADIAREASEAVIGKDVNADELQVNEMDVDVAKKPTDNAVAVKATGSAPVGVGADVSKKLVRLVNKKKLNAKDTEVNDANKEDKAKKVNAKDTEVKENDVAKNVVRQVNKKKGNVAVVLSEEKAEEVANEAGKAVHTRFHRKKEESLVKEEKELKEKAKDSKFVNRKRKLSDSPSSKEVNRKKKVSEVSEVVPDVVKMVMNQLSKIKSEEFDPEILKKGKKKSLKRVKKEESDDDIVKKKGKKLLSPAEAAHEAYLLKYPSIHARTNPGSLFNAIHNTPFVDMSTFLESIGFGSFINFPLEKLPMKLGMYVVKKFKNYKLRITDVEETPDESEAEDVPKIEVTPYKIHEMLGIPIGGRPLFSLPERKKDDDFKRKWAQQFSKEVKLLRVADIAEKLTHSKEIDFFFKVNFLTLFTNTMCKADSLKGQICMDVVKRIRPDTVISEIDWCGYLYDCLGEHKIPTGTNNYLGPLTFLILLYLDSTKYERLPYIRKRPALKNWSFYLMKQRQDKELEDEVVGKLDLRPEWTEHEAEESEGFTEINEEDFLKKAEEKLSSICYERVCLEGLLKKAHSKSHGDGKFIDIFEKYSSIFKDPIAFVDDGTDGIDGGNDDVDGHDGDDDVDGNDGDGNGGNGDENENDANPKGNPFGFDKISLDQIQSDSCPSEIEPSQTKPMEEGKAEADKKGEEGGIEEGDEEVAADEIMSSPDEYTQWLHKNIYMVEELCDSEFEEYLHGDLFGDNSTAREALCGEKQPNQNLPSQERNDNAVELHVSPYMNKKTDVASKITKSEFIVANSLFCMNGDLLEDVFEAHSGDSIVQGVRLNLETLAPGLWIDANVIDCWVSILNYEEQFRDVDAKARHFFPTGCITEAMLDGTCLSFDAKWKRFSEQVNAQFKGKEDSISLEGIDLVFFPILMAPTSKRSGHFYVVVFSISKSTPTVILDNSPGTYDSKYKGVCELLKKLLCRHLKTHGHSRLMQASKIKHSIPKLEWKTKNNFHDCGVFAMLHMEYFNGLPVSEFECGLSVESDLQLDQLRRLRFKFATKILMHEINMFAEKMMGYANEFSKMSGPAMLKMITDAVKNRNERDQSVMM